MDAKPDAGKNTLAPVSSGFSVPANGNKGGDVATHITQKLNWPDTVEENEGILCYLYQFIFIWNKSFDEDSTSSHTIILFQCNQRTRNRKLLLMMLSSISPTLIFLFIPSNRSAIWACKLIYCFFGLQLLIYIFVL